MLIILLVLIGLSVLILAHEAAHFLFAKMFGLKVDEFGFGFPPRIGAKKIGDTEYSFNWLPFGGFVKIAGENGEFELLESESGKQSASADNVQQANDKGISQYRNIAISKFFFAQPAWKKSIILLGGVIMNFVLGWLLISAVLMVGTPKAVVITDVEPGSPAAVAGIQSGDAIQGYATAQSVIDFVNAHRGQPITLNFLRDAKDISVAGNAACYDGAE